jgi:hypothetical protein
MDTEDRLHENAREWMDRINLKYNWAIESSLDEYLIDSHEELTVLDLSEGLSILKEFENYETI